MIRDAASSGGADHRFLWSANPRSGAGRRPKATVCPTLVFTLFFALCAGAADVPRRIVSLSPNLTEILYGIGAFPQVVGVTDYCSYPPEVVKIPSVGGWANPSFEKLLVLRPDLVILDDAQAPLFETEFPRPGFAHAGGARPQHRAGVRRHGRPSAAPPAMPKLPENSPPPRAKGWRKSRTGRRRFPIPALSSSSTARPEPCAIFTPLTGGGFLAELVDIAGGRITGPPAKSGYGKMSKEDLARHRPRRDSRFHARGHRPSSAAAPLEAWQEMPELKAVRAAPRL